jgi:hypothetical protein
MDVVDTDVARRLAISRRGTENIVMNGLMRLWTR